VSFVLQRLNTNALSIYLMPVDAVGDPKFAIRQAIAPCTLPDYNVPAGQFAFIEEMVSQDSVETSWETWAFSDD
jgi:hypothetical protein